MLGSVASAMLMKSLCWRGRPAQPQRSLSALFCGSDAFSQFHLQRLVGESDLLSRLDVVTPPDKPSGRGLINTSCPLKIAAIEHGLAVFDAPATNLAGWMVPSSIVYDLAIVVSFNYFLPASLLRTFRKGGLNVHPSLLPKYRGAAPIQHTLLNGEKQTGVSIIDLDPNTFDAGKILAQAQMPIPHSETIMYSELEQYLARIGADLLVETIRTYDLAKKDAKTQDTSQITQAPKIQKSIGVICWTSMSSTQIYNLYRAVSHQIPLMTTFRGQQVHMDGLLLSSNTDVQSKLLPTENITPGTLFYNNVTSTLWIRTGIASSPSSTTTTWVGCQRVKMINRKWQHVRDFVNGYKIINLYDQFGT